MSNKYILAAIGLALVRAGEILVAHSEQFNADDEFIGGVSNERLGLIDTDDTTPTYDNPPPRLPAAQISPNQIANAELDADGLPWDARIHASTKTKTQKSQWTRRKGIADATYNAVLAELRQQYAAPAVTAPTPPAVTAPTPPAVTAPTPPAISVPAPAAQTPYTMLTDWLARNTGDGKALSAAYVNQVFADNGTSLAALANNQDASTQFLDAFKGVLNQMGIAEQ